MKACLLAIILLVFTICLCKAQSDKLTNLNFAEKEKTILRIYDSIGQIEKNPSISEERNPFGIWFGSSYCVHRGKVSGIKLVDCPYIIAHYYRLYCLYDSSFASKCVFLADEKTDRYIDFGTYYSPSDDGSVIFKKKEYKRLKRASKKWVGRMKKKGLPYLVEHKISPLDGSGLKWKKY